MSKRTRKRAAALLAAAILFSPAAPAAAAHLSQAEMDALAQERAVFVGEIRVEGARRTRDRILLQELIVEPGDVYDAARVEESRRLVQNLGIFTFVRFEFAPSASAEDAFDLFVVVKERWTLLPEILLTRRPSGRSNIGVKLKERNFMGRGQSLDVEASKVGADDFKINLGWQGSIRFREPRLFGTYYALAAKVSRKLDFERVFDGAVVLAEHGIETDGLSLSVGRRIRPRHRVSLTADYEDIEYRLFSGGPPRQDRQLVGASVDYLWNRANLHPWFITSGFTVDTELIVYSRAFGSELSSEEVGAGWRWYRRFGEYGNLRLRFRAARLFSGDFDTFAKHLGGSDDVRGYEEGQYRGRENWYGGAETRFPLGRPFWKDRLMWGWGAFVDAGDTAFRTLDDPGEWKVGVGGGFRLYAQKIFDGILSVDVAYGFDVHDWKIIVDIGKSF